MTTIAIDVHDRICQDLHQQIRSLIVENERLKAAAQQALEALEALQGGCTDSNDGTVEAITVWCPEIIDALRAALAELERQP